MRYKNSFLRRVFAGFALGIPGLMLCAATLKNNTALDVGVGESFTATGKYTIPTFCNNGTLTLANGADIIVEPYNVLTSSVIAVGAPVNATLNLESGSRLHFQAKGRSEKNYEVLAIGVTGGTGTVNVASGAVLSTYKGNGEDLRIRMTRNADLQRNFKTYAVMNVAGTVDIGGTLEMAAFWPSSAGVATNLFPHVSELNLLPGGVFSAMQVRANDAAIARVNFKGGKLLMTKAETSYFSTGHGAIFELDFAEGTTSTIETAGDLVFSQSSTNNISGSGTLVKKGAGILSLKRPAGCGYNSFTGNIRIEEGSVYLGRPLAQGQEVYVCAGAGFDVSALSDYDQVTYEVPGERPDAGGLYVVNESVTGGIDLLSTTFDHGKLGGPMVPNAYVTVEGEVTHAEVTEEHPFELVGRAKSSTVEFRTPGLDDVPLLLNGAGTFRFPGDRDLWQSESGRLQFNGGTYYKNGTVSIFSDPDGVYRIENGSIRANKIFIGADGTNSSVVVSGGELRANDTFYVGSSRGSERHHTYGSLTLTNASLIAGASIRIGATGLQDGTSYLQPYGSLTLQKDSEVSGFLIKNDEGSGEVVFDGGIWRGWNVSNAYVFQNNQTGSLTVRGTNGNDIIVNIANTTNSFVSSPNDAGKLRLTSDGGGLVFRGRGKITVNGSEFTADYSGDTVIEDKLVVLNGDNPFPFGAGKGKLLVKKAEALDLNGRTLSVNDVAGSDSKALTNSVSSDAVLRIGCDNRDVDFTAALLGNIKLAKDGTGTLTAHAALPKKLDVTGGKVIAGAPCYKHYRFKVDRVYGNAASSFQIAEFKLMNGDRDVTRPYAMVGQATSGASPEAEMPAKAVDGKLDTKFLDFNAAFVPASGRTASDEQRANCWLQLDYDQPLFVTHYTWATGNDKFHPDDDPDCRNPKDWRLQGSDDGVTWTDLDVRTGYKVSDAKASTWIGDVFALGGSSAEGGAVVNVEEGATLEINNIFEVAEIASNGRTIVNEGASLRIASGVCGGNFEGSGTIEKVGAGAAIFSVNDGFAGTVAVRKGAVSLSRGIASKWFRFTIRRTHSDADAAMQFSEFKLFDAAGNRQGLNLTEASAGTLPKDLKPGEFCKEENYPCGGKNGITEDVGCLFDGSAATKWCATEVPDLKYGTDESHWRTFTLRLSDDATPIVSFNLTSANDSPARTPSSWLLEASDDGETWTTLDDRTGVAKPAVFTDLNGVVPFTLISTGGGAANTAMRLEIASGAAVNMVGDGTKIAELHVDCIKGAGALNGASFATAGAIYLTGNNESVKSLKTIPLTLVNVRDASALSGWKVYVNGVQKNGWKVSASNGTLSLSTGGFTVYLR